MHTFNIRLFLPVAFHIHFFMLSVFLMRILHFFVLILYFNNFTIDLCEIKKKLRLKIHVCMHVHTLHKQNICTNTFIYINFESKCEFCFEGRILPKE